MLRKLELNLLNSNVTDLHVSDIFSEETEFYGSDINKEHLQSQLTLLHTGSELPLKDLKSVISYLKSLSTTQRDFYSEVMNVAKLILVMPATNATSERTFSALQRLKTWLRTTSSQARLNWRMLLHVHNERTDALCMQDLLNDFASRNDSRKRLFGHF